jgi:hypothetical protein
LKVSVDFIAGKTLAEGEYRGALTIAGPGEPPLVREIPVSVKVAFSAPEMKVDPEKLALSAKGQGWVEASWGITLATPFPCDVAMTPETLVLQGGAEAKGTIFRDFDIRLVPEEGWTGVRMEGGKSYRCRYRVYVSSNLPKGTYLGAVTVDLSGQGKTAKVAVPVELKVE